MSHLHALRILTAFTSFALFAAVPAGAGAADGSTDPACDRTCLEGHLDAYLNALTGRDPNRMPLTPDAKYTENGVHLPFGDAAWGTVSDMGRYRLVMADVEMSEIAIMGVAIENEVFPGLMATRLKVEGGPVEAGGQVSEVETIFVRNQTAAERLEEMASPRAALTTRLPRGERPSRQELVATANLYFNGLQDNDGTRYVPFAGDCHRLENGNPATNAEIEDTGGYPPEFARMGCDEQFRLGLFRTDTDLRERRFRVVDREYGLVFVFVFFDHDATIREFQLRDGRMRYPRLAGPHTWQIAEVFKIEDGQISQIEAILHQVPYGMSSGWHDCSGVFPRPCTEPGAPFRKIRVGHNYPDRREELARARGEIE